MTIRMSLARALAPVAIIAAAPTIAAAPSPDLARLKEHLSSVQTMTANFTQTDARGQVSTGTLQMKRPGRIRFEYRGGDVLIVADGKRLTFLDYSVGQKSSWPLSGPRSGRCSRARPISTARPRSCRAPTAGWSSRARRIQGNTAS